MRKDKTAAALRNDRITAAIFIAVIMCAIAAGFDYYYDLNDDVLMKDILAGIYTGTPETHNIQMLWPVSAFISLLYSVCPAVPWMGTVLCLFQYGCLYMIVCRTLSFFEKKRTRALMLFVSAALIFSYLLEHLVFIQYTVTAAIMAATAAYLFYTTKEGLDEKQFIRAEIPPVILVVLAFQVRSELMLLLLPMMGAAVLIRWNREKNPLAATNCRRYMYLILMVTVLCGASYGADKLAYGSDGWKSFEELFNNRTQLYDYQSVPEYSGNSEFYSGMGLKQSEQELLKNYNYGIDDRIDAGVLGKTAAYADSIRVDSKTARLKKAFENYVYRSFHKSEDFPWNLTLIVMYVAAFVAIMIRREGTWHGNMVKAVCRLGFLLIVRSGLWMYILYGNRYPVRITHSLYFMEMCILMAMLLVEFRCKVRDQNYLMMLNGVIAVVALCILTPYNISDVHKAQEQREYVNQDEKAIRTFCMGHPDNYYFEDVYTTVGFSQKVFDSSVSRRMSNYDIMGGWACGSPLWYKKLAACGMTDAGQAIVKDSRVRIISEESTDLTWLSDFYRDRGLDVSVTRTDEINGIYGVYKVSISDK